MENSPNRPTVPYTQYGRWTDAEYALITDLASTSPTKDLLLSLFPGRTLCAVRRRLSEERRRQGIPLFGQQNNNGPRRDPATLHPAEPGIMGGTWSDTWRERAVASNRAYLDSLAPIIERVRRAA